jgi:hypothetical protein
MEIRSYRPEGFTESPHQDPEHMHTKLIKDIPVLEETYIHVSDDDGTILGDPKLEKKARDFYQRLPRILRGHTRGFKLDEVKKFTINYCKQINIAETIKRGVFSKYWIRSGVFFITMKVLVKESGQLWEAWFIDNFKGIITIRHAQYCMQLAKIPNIIRYSVFGIPRLLEIIRAVGPSESDDPVADFLQQHLILFNPATEPDLEGDKVRVDAIKVEVDFVIAKRMLEKDGLYYIDNKLLRALVATNKNFKCTKTLRKKLQKIQENGEDPNKYLQILSLTGGIEPDTDREGLRSHLDRVGAVWIDSAEYYLKKPERLRTIDYRITDTMGTLLLKIKEKRNEF